MTNGIGGHTRPIRGQSDDWITPRHVLAALGRFDLDPCQSLTQPWPCAERGYTVVDDGLVKQWKTKWRVFCNPPYGDAAGPFMQRLAAHRNGIGLLFGRTETEMFRQHIWREADAVLFLAGRLHFHYPDPQNPQHCLTQEHVWVPREAGAKKLWCCMCGKAHGNSGGPSVLVAYGEENVESLRSCGLPGALVTGWEFRN